MTMFSTAVLLSSLLTFMLPIHLSMAAGDSYVRSESNAAMSRLQKIKEYFFAGFKYCEIVLILYKCHNISISIRHLKRILRINNLRRRNYENTQFEDVENIIRNEIMSSGQCVGYRSMWQRLVNDYQIKVKRNEVMRLMREIDPEGVASRKAHRLTRRRYNVKGPNFVWHIDGYDKLSPFGFCIHGAIDGYSRRIMWLEVGASNKDPKVIAYYYLNTIKNMKCAPRVIRSDCGTENSYISFLQPFIRHSHRDSLAGMKSFMYGKSTSNQRIEAWWSYLRRQGIHWWINKLKDLRDRGRYDSLNPIHVECLRFCLFDVLQAELDRIADLWNVHNIRPQKMYRDLPCGKPFVLHHVPELYGGHDLGKPVNLNDVELCFELYAHPKQTWSNTFTELAYCFKPDLQTPSNAEDGFRLYEELISVYDQEVNGII